MKRIIAPGFLSKVIAVFVALYMLMVGFASFAPPIISTTIASTDGEISAKELSQAVQLYIDEASKVTGIEKKYVRNSFITNSIIVFPAFIICFMVIFKMEWGRKSLIIYLLLLMVAPIIVYEGNPKYIKYMINPYTILFIAMIWYLQRKKTKEHFIENEI